MFRRDILKAALAGIVVGAADLLHVGQIVAPLEDLLPESAPTEILTETITYGTGDFYQYILEEHFRPAVDDMLKNQDTLLLRRLPMPYEGDTKEPYRIFPVTT